MGAAERKKSSFLAVVLFLVLLGAIFVLSMNMLVRPSSTSDGLLKASFLKNKVALVRLEGVIVDSSDVVEQIEQWAEDGSVRAIVIRIESPGGGVAPSQEIFRAVREADEKKPVIASMGSVAASGGYYVAAGCRRIVADAGTITGSIGVIMVFSNTEKLMGKIGLGTEVVKSGKFKDSGSPHRPFTEEDRKLMQGVVDDIYDQFVAHVSDGRGIAPEEVRKLADGRIYTGRQALELKLVDELGGMNDAVMAAGKLAGIAGEPEVVEKKKEPGFLEWLMGEDFKASFAARLTMPTGAYFLWPAW